MKQSRIMSGIETTLNIGSGVLIALCLTYWVLPLWGHQYSASQSIGITALYSAVSWIRSFAWRRYFARRFH